MEPISYGENHSDLPAFLDSIFPSISKPPIKSKQKTSNSSQEKHKKVIDEYRKFLIKDCGQMTIEGVRADLDTAQRRFDIERLFVPLHVTPCPPEIHPQDKDGHEKHEKWLQESQKVIPFGKILSEEKNIVLLALPGGGKTLLLKRLAAAYSSPNRITLSNDNLPDLDVLPILIRCREWREKIKLPLTKVLENIPDNIGNDELSGFGDAIKPLLKEGKILLLIDGLDEIHVDSDREIFVENLQKFIEKHPKIKTVTTSREAGFNLVAPCLSQFCSKWRISPLQESEIYQLCDYWHKLMMGETLEAKAEGRQLADRLTSSPSVSRLAENPLLLTMLLVVKHGAGRLPPDRVSLYSRAVEVLLDTWNIKGHEALNPREAVPQLAYIAFELMKSGRQTATERELLSILEEAREKVPQIKLYAKDTPYDFLKRVELRSSLLVEDGHQLEHGKTVPFYQFRHLTFQEYLAATAVAEGNYNGYQKTSTVLKPLKPFLTAPEWKEVIPMTAVLAGKQARPIISELAKRASRLKTSILQDRNFQGKEEWLSYNGIAPAAISRLIQCCIEESEIDPELVDSILEISALICRGGRIQADWHAFRRGPFGERLLRQALQIYESGNYTSATWSRNTLAYLASIKYKKTHWFSQVGIDEILILLNSDSTHDQCLGLSILAGNLWGSVLPEEQEDTLKAMKPFMAQLDILAQSDLPYIRNTAAWVLGLFMHQLKNPLYPSPKALNHLAKTWINLEPKGKEDFLIPFCLSYLIVKEEGYWTPELSPVEVEKLQALSSQNTKDEEDDAANLTAYAAIAYHMGDAFPRENLIQALTYILDDRDSLRPHLIKAQINKMVLLLRKLKSKHRQRKLSPA